MLKFIQTIFEPVFQSQIHGRHLEKGQININPNKVIIGIGVILAVLSGLGLLFGIAMIIKLLSKKKKTGPMTSGQLQRKYTGTIPSDEKKFGQEMDDDEIRRSLRASKKGSLRKSAIQRAETIQRVGPNLYGLNQDEIDAIYP